MTDSLVPFESTAHDALIAELLGDVGRLHEEIKALPNAIAVLEPVVERLALARGEFDSAATKAQKVFSRDANVLLDAHMESALHAFDVRVEQSLQRYFTGPIAQARRSIARRLLIFSLLACLFGGIGSTVTTLLILPGLLNQNVLEPPASLTANPSKTVKHP